MKPASRSLPRRAFIAKTAALTAATLAGGRMISALAADAAVTTRQAMGTKAGEVTDTSAIIWTRLTEKGVRNNGGLVVAPRAKKAKKQEKAEKKEEKTELPPTAQLEGACPGAAGRVRVRYGTREDLSDAQATDWLDVTAANDFIHQFAIKGLKPATVYHYATETTGPGGAAKHGAFRGKFETAPAASAPGNFRFCVMTCQGYHDRGNPDGHPIYPSMLKLAPQFVAFTGDNVYYDSNEPIAVSPELARHHWERMFSLPRQIELLRNVSSYFEKDDHDTLDNDSWPGRKAGQLTWAEGQRIYRQQVPMGESIYRTYRWGRDLQIWLTDGRDFRSPNNQPDGPGKTIWGAEQKEWFKRTMKASDATWRILISPTPIVGPDRGNKNDNHANTGFTHEGDELRAWLQANAPENFFVLCGDRHWQYHSVHPQTNVMEFSVGPASDEHASGSPGEDKTYHRFHRVKGGFLSVTLKRSGRNSRIHFEHRDVDGKTVYEWSKERAVT